MTGNPSPKKAFAVLLFFVAFLSAPYLSAEPAKAEANPLDKITLNYDPSATLSRDELATVVALVKECGVYEIEEVATYPLPLTDYYLICVKSRERSNGRTSSFQRVIVGSEKFISKSFRNKATVQREKGIFWITKGNVTTVTLTMFTVLNKTLRVNVGKDVPMPTADRIVKAFAQGKVHYAHDGLRQNAEGSKIDLSSPSAIFVEKGVNTYSVIFLTTAANGVSLTVTARNDITVTEADLWTVR